MNRRLTLSKHALGESERGTSKVEKSLNVPEAQFGLQTVVK